MNTGQRINPNDANLSERETRKKALANAHPRRGERARLAAARLDHEAARVPLVPNRPGLEAAHVEVALAADVRVHVPLERLVPYAVGVWAVGVWVVGVWAGVAPLPPPRKPRRRPRM